VRVKATQSNGACDIFVAEATIAEPIWPELTSQELLRIGFRIAWSTTSITLC
jgi:hypothetical protein